jgi:serine/threonine protein kinase
LGPGDDFAGFTIEAIAGRGGMGLVYRARQKRPDRLVALKVIAPELAADVAFRARFEGEASIAAQIEHPNVIPVYAVGDEHGVLYIAMRFVDGVDLGGVVAREGKLSPIRTARLITQIAGALDAAHARGLVHRDIKPANVLIAAGDHAYLTDFGLTKLTADSQGMTKTGMFVGTVDYMAPEQVDGRRIDARADVYALGCVTYQLLTGTVPFPRGSDMAKLYAHVNDPPPRLEGVAVPLADAVERAMAKEPDDRFLSAGDFGRAVEAGARGVIDVSDGRTVATGPAAFGELPMPGVDPRIHGPTELAPADDGRTELASTASAGTPPAADETVLESGPRAPRAATTEVPAGNGRRPRGPRRSLHGWRALIAGLLLVAVVGGGVAAALVASSSSSTTSTETVFRHTKAGNSTPASTSTPRTTSTTPAPSPTQVQIFNVLSPSGSLAVHVTNTVSGSCFTSSSAVARADAWRCTVGNNLVDPCFETGAEQVLCPIGGPFGGTGLLVNLPSNDLSNQVPNKDSGTKGLPWAIELDNGWKCLAFTGATNVIDGQRLGYGCSNGAGLYGNPHRSSSVWTIYGAGAHANTISSEPIKAVWF